ncbi:DUF3224 domain-containing protein [Actinomycetospora termitidis]|uniref:DUF3224 domain-containing protein n=1 Tax=Actinomycetospora termitidis TaxID=3053470 RepID=A0ABT7M4X7_9PSEU|nr:DUF3224 domain-containing protein [Actinomycetospora sp. Odt1-22]MDL5155279.1 DUF3224 domain-containing protein [Actinomycetospora sp. Odt1-22]
MSETTEAAAAFTIDAWEETTYDDPAEGPKLTRVVVRKTYDGVLRGTGVAEVLTAQGGGSGFVASERIVGTLDGRAGSFVIQHGGLADPDGTTSTFGAIVPSSGTGELAGISGEATEGTPGTLTLRYRF